jgi:xanthine/uracil permease
MALSFCEDVGAISLTWIATQHPYVAAAVVAVLLGLIIVFVRWVIRSLRNLYRRTGAALSGA